MEAYQHELSLEERIQCGAKIRKTRRDKGYPVWIVAQLLEINEETLRRYEAGERWPGFETVMRLAAILGVSTDDFLPDGFYERHTPPRQLLESLGELLRFPVRMLAEQERGSRSNRRSSARSQEVEKRADQLSATVKQVKRNTAKRISKRCCTEPIPDQDGLFCLSCGEAVYYTDIPLVAAG